MKIKNFLMKSGKDQMFYAVVAWYIVAFHTPVCETNGNALILSNLHVNSRSTFSFNV